MGALVGGLYATGRSPAELRTIVKEAPWETLLAGTIPFRVLSFRRREDRTAYPNLLEFGLKNGVSLPSGLNLGHDIGLLLSRWTLAYPEMESFDDLPTPFRAVATNLVTGEEEVLRKGVLADALRATMSLPWVFKPANRGGKLYVDGALLQNLPVDVARQMGADIVIAVHLGKAPVDPKTLGSFPGVIDRSIGIVVSANEMRMMERADIVVTVDLARFVTNDYPKSEELADAGKAATAKKVNILETFALEPTEWAAYQKARQGRRRAEPTQVTSVKVEAVDRGQSKLIAETVGPVVEAAWNPLELERVLTQVVGAGRLASARYSVRGSELLVQAEEQMNAPPFLLPLLEIDGSDLGNTRVSAGARVTFMGLGTSRAEWRTDLVGGGHGFGWRASIGCRLASGADGLAQRGRMWAMRRFLCTRGRRRWQIIACAMGEWGRMWAISLAGRRSCGWATRRSGWRRGGGLVSQFCRTIATGWMCRRSVSIFGL